MDRPYIFNGHISRADGSPEPISIQVAVPEKTSDPLYRCVIRSTLLPKTPYRVYSGLAHDAWAEAFEVLNQALRQADAVLLDDKGGRVELPSPPRDLSWVRPPRIPEVVGIEPIYRVAGWVRKPGLEPQRVELAIWPALEEESGTFCAPMRCALRRRGTVMCSYGASAEQAVYLAYKYLRIEVEHDVITDNDGRLLDIPIPPEPPPIEASIPTD